MYQDFLQIIGIILLLSYLSVRLILQHLDRKRGIMPKYGVRIFRGLYMKGTKKEWLMLPLIPLLLFGIPALSLLLLELFQ